MKPEHPASLAIFRVVVLSVILLSPEVDQAAGYSALSPALRVVPEGLGWAVQLVPITPAVARATEAVLWVSALSGLLGLFCRASLLLVTLSGLYLFALSQLGGAVTHDMHLPSLCRFGALLVVAFELSFLPLLLWRRGRWMVLLGGLLFHLLSEVFLRIRFVSLWACYVVLIDWGTRGMVGGWSRRLPAGWPRGRGRPLAAALGHGLVARGALRPRSG